jgi:hypothetical protein
VVFASFAAVACGAGESEPVRSGPVEKVPEACVDLAVERFRELIAVDDFVTDDDRGKNALAGAWSFRRVVEALTPAGTTPSDYVKVWLESWVRTQRINSFEVVPRPQVESIVLCPWLQRRAENGCDADCKSCQAEELDLDQAPFRLLAIVNRIDLRRLDHDVAPAGEGRLVFGLVRGAGDDPAAAPLRMTAIFEFAYPTLEGQTARDWAERWHALGAESSDESFKQSLQAITDDFVSAESLRQIRTNERDLEWRWELRQFVHGANGLPVPAVTSNTPDASLNSSSPLRDYLLANRAGVLSEAEQMPPRLLGGATPGDLVWRVNVDEPLRKAFANQTCNGCHMTEQRPVDIAFHISPQRRGRERLSPYLQDPENPEHDELARRADSLRAALCDQ